MSQNNEEPDEVMWRLDNLSLRRTLLCSNENIPRRVNSQTRIIGMIEEQNQLTREMMETMRMMQQEMKDLKREFNEKLEKVQEKLDAQNEKINNIAESVDFFKKKYLDLITVYVDTQADELVPIEIDSSASVSELIKEIRDTTGYQSPYFHFVAFEPPNQSSMSAFREGQELTNDGKTLKDCNISNDTIIRIFVCFRDLCLYEGCA